MILPTRAEIIELAQNQALLDAVFSERWECRYQHFDAIAQELANAHNEGDINLLDTLSPNALDGYSGHQGYQGRRIYSLAIGRLDITLGGLLGALRILAALSADEQHQAIETLSQWCGSSPDRPNELLSLIDSGQLSPDEFYSLAIAIRTGLKANFSQFCDRAYNYIRTGTPIEKMPVIQALSSPPFNLRADWHQALGIFRDSIAAESTEELRGTLVSTLLSWTESIPAEFATELEALISQSSIPTFPQVAHNLAYALAFSNKNLSPSLRMLLLSLLSAIDLAPQTQKLVDLGLAHLIGVGGVDDAREFIGKVLLKPGSVLRLQDFDSTVRKLEGGPVKDFEIWAVDWLRSAQNSLYREVSDGLFHNKEEYIFQLDFNQFDFTHSEIEEMARRAVTTFFMKPQIAASFLVCLGRCTPALTHKSVYEEAKTSAESTTAPSLSHAIRAALESAWKHSATQNALLASQQTNPSPLTLTSQVLSDLLFESLLINYTSAQEQLRPIADNRDDKAAPMVQIALDRLKEYCDGLEEVGFIAELQPSERELQLEGQRRADVMSDMMQESRKSSPLAGLFSESILLHGNGMVTWIDDSAYQAQPKNGEVQGTSHLRRMEQSLAGISHSFELPREEVLDPIGLQVRLFNLNTQGRPK
ncbi:hypothetical protein BK645_06300 [Pseudomonas protegens]|uniref:hypothetical protein n=1 Tax=Pseudomonas protegens TaxID=380021 RepID=UPI00036A924E|nr:hypothetical protein [Pseudomonas protegens]ROM28581.1 hypothetical protein BK645_06300 [Pseudomonas protegens]ROM36212.1 hypothetical protein BK646_14340 [Pseudomonas protegens]